MSQKSASAITNETLISLCVGGVSYIASYQTLKDSLYLKETIDGKDNNTTYINENEIFIDRSGRLFEYVLRYLRSNDFQTDDEQCLRELLIEAEYYSLPELYKTLLRKLEQKNQREHALLNWEELMASNSLSRDESSGEAIICDTYDVKCALQFEAITKQECFNNCFNKGYRSCNCFGKFTTAAEGYQKLLVAKKRRLM